MSSNFLITQVNVTGTTQYTQTVFVYATTVNPSNGFEWGAACPGNSNTPVANFPIVPQGSPYPGVSYLQVATFQGEYQLYSQDNGDGTSNLMAQVVSSPLPYPNNQVVLLQNVPNAGCQLLLTVNLSAAPMSALTLAVQPQAQKG